MSKRAGTYSLLAAGFLLTVGLCGCGGGGAPATDREEVAKLTGEEGFGMNIKNVLYEFRARVRKRGITAVKQDLPIVLESFGGYESQPLGDHAATYKEIFEKLKAMESISNRDAAVKAVEEIGTLADKLPGNANPNPVITD
jgi:hypothetical protein